MFFLSFPLPTITFHAFSRYFLCSITFPAFSRRFLAIFLHFPKLFPPFDAIFLHFPILFLSFPVHTIIFPAFSQYFVGFYDIILQYSATKIADLGGIDTPPSANCLVVHNPAKCSISSPYSQPESDGAISSTTPPTPPILISFANSN